MSISQDQEFASLDRKLRLLLINLNHLENKFWRLEENLAGPKIHHDSAARGSSRQSFHCASPDFISIDGLDYSIRCESDSDSDSDSCSTADSIPGTEYPTALQTQELASATGKQSLILRRDHDLIFRDSASWESVANTEKQLSTQLPQDFIHFLQLSNGLKRFPSDSDPGLRGVQHFSVGLPPVQTNSRNLSGRFGLCWQDRLLLGKNCPAYTYFPEPRTLVKISNDDAELHVWLVSPQGMQRAKSCGLHRSFDARNGDTTEPGSGFAQKAFKSDWGVLRWVDTQGSARPHKPADLHKPLPPCPINTAAADHEGQADNNIRGKLNAGLTCLYDSFSEYLDSLAKSLESAYLLEVGL